MRPAKSWLACAPALAVGGAAAQGADGHAGWPGAGQLFVGTNYQPFDRSRDQIVHDIARMKQAGFKVVRMGDLSWDSSNRPRGGSTSPPSTGSWTRCRPRA